MNKTDKTKLILVVNTVVALLVAYCMVKYTKTMKEDTTCRMVKENQRKFLYYSGLLIIADIIFTVGLKLM